MFGFVKAMSTGQRKCIDWTKTGKNLQLLRRDNIALRRFVCRTLNLDKGDCDGMCETCRYEMDNSISRVELSRIFLVSESVIFNWESGKTPVSLPDQKRTEAFCRSPVIRVHLDDIVIFTGSDQRRREITAGQILEHPVPLYAPHQNGAVHLSALHKLCEAGNIIGCSGRRGHRRHC